MKLHLIYIIGIICILFSCSNPSKETLTVLSPELQQAESIMYQAPDSALRILQNMPAPPASDSLQYATWALFTTQAKYKLYMEQSDSLINIAYPYFLQHGDAQRKALALYYKAVLCKEHNQIEEAQKFCLEAAKEVDKTTDYQLGHLIYSELTWIYGSRNLDEYALRTVEKELEYAQKSINPSYIYNGYIHKGRIYKELKRYEEAIIWYKKTILHLEKLDYKHKYKYLSATISELAEAYNNIEKYDSALYYMHQSMDLKRKYKLGESSIDYRRIGLAYYYINEPDSAIYYLNKALNTSNTSLSIIGEVQQLLYFAYSKKQEYQKAAEHCFQFCIALDSLYRMEKSQALIEMQEKYNQQKLINEKNELRIKKDEVTRNALIALLAAACIIATLIYIYQRKLRKKERQIQEAKEKANKKSLQIQENELTISRNQKRMKELMEQIEANKGIQEEWEEQKHILANIREQNEMLEQKNQDLLKGIQDLTGTLDTQSHDLEQLKTLMEENAYLHEREWGLFHQLMKQDKTLSKLKSTPRSIKEEEWPDIMKAMNGYLDNFTQRIGKAVPSITQNEVHLCCLIKLRFSTADIATLLSIEPNSVYRRKTRLKERITQKTGNWEPNMTLDLWIWNF